MKFYGNGVVWDAENNKPLCRFQNGELDTEDDRVVWILADLGYKFEGELPDDDDGNDGNTGEGLFDQDDDGLLAGLGLTEPDAAMLGLPVPDPISEPTPEITDRKEIYKLLEAKGITFHKNAPTASLLKLLGGA